MFTINSIKLKHRKGYDVIVSLKDTDVTVGILFQERKPTKVTLKAIDIVAKFLFKDVTDDMEEISRKKNIFASGKLVNIVKEFLSLGIIFQSKGGNNYYIFKKGRELFSLEYDVTDKRICYCVCPIYGSNIDMAIELHTTLNKLESFGLTPDLVLESFDI